MSKQITYKSSDCADKVFSLADKISGKNPNMFRTDPYGNQICKTSYEKHLNKDDKLII